MDKRKLRSSNSFLKRLEPSTSQLSSPGQLDQSVRRIRSTTKGQKKRLREDSDSPQISGDDDSNLNSPSKDAVRHAESGNKFKKSRQDSTSDGEGRKGGKASSASPKRKAVDEKRTRKDSQPPLMSDKDDDDLNWDFPSKDGTTLAKATKGRTSPILSVSSAGPARPSTFRLVSQSKNSLEKSRDERTFSRSCERDGEDELSKFLRASGIILSTNDEPHVLSDVFTKTTEKMERLLSSSGQFQGEAIVSQWREYIREETNLQKALNETRAENTHDRFDDLNKTSLVRIILQVPRLQTDIMNSLFERLIEAILMADRKEDVPWASLLLQQIRFLERVVDTGNLTVRLEELLDSCPEWFQREVILFLPDIVVDAQHHHIAEILFQTMENNSQLISVILDCITNLTLGKEYLEELREKVLGLLRGNFRFSALPAITRFVLTECPNVDVCKRCLSRLREADTRPLVGENLEDCFTDQSLAVNSLRISMLLSKDVVKAATLVVKEAPLTAKDIGDKCEATAWDLILVLLISSCGTAKKREAEGTLRHHLRTGFYRSRLLRVFYNDYKKVARDLQPVAMKVASSLLKSDDSVFVDFGVEWFRHLLVSEADVAYKQREILEKIILLMGDNDRTAKNALSVLCRMADSEGERKYLPTHCNHLRILLEKVDHFGLEEVATLNDLLHGLCTNSNSIADALREDLSMLLQKQLSAPKPLTKSKGVLGSVMAIKHLAGQENTCRLALDLFEQVMNAVKNCPRSQALFYDQMAQVLAQTRKIDANVLQIFTDRFEDVLINTHMTDRTSYSGELIPKFGLNVETEESQGIVVQFSNGKYGAIVSILFRLLKVCNLRTSESGNLSEINALLGCAVLMPPNFDSPEPAVVDLMIHCVNWFRETIGGFVTEDDPTIQRQVLERLNDLMQLQGELSTVLAMCEARYQPPACYFHQFPTPPFVRVEKKVGRKGAKGQKANVDKSGGIPDWESWEMGAALSRKNPMYFRRLDAKVAHLLDKNINLQVSQTSGTSISVAQVCFIIGELLGMFEVAEITESFVRDLISLLPKICGKLQRVVTELRDKNNNENGEATRLLLSLLSKICGWKGFQTGTHDALLREVLRTMASLTDKSNATLRSAKELVAEAYKYFESLADVATQLSIALALVDMCRSLTQHSQSLIRQNKGKLACMAYGFLSLEWPGSHAGQSYKIAVGELLKNWIDNEPDPLCTVTMILEWLPAQVPNLKKPQDSLNRLPSVNRATFHLLLRKLFDGLIRGAKISMERAKTDPKRIEIWHNVSSNVNAIARVCKGLTTKANLLLFIRYMPTILKLFLTLGMPVLEENLKYQVTEVTRIFKLMQVGTNYLHTACCDSTQKKDVALAKYVPAAKSALESLVYSVKGMLVLNNSPAAFWMGNLINKDLEGHEILSQTSSEEQTSSADLNTDHVSDGELSDVLGSDVDNDGDDSTFSR